MARKPKLGSGKRFKALVKSIMERSHVSKEAATRIAAAIGMKKYGKKKMLSMAKKGRKRRKK